MRCADSKRKNERSYCIWLIRGQCDGDLLLVREPQLVVCASLRGFMPFRICLRLFARRMAIRSSGTCLVRRRRQKVVARRIQTTDSRCGVEGKVIRMLAS